MLPELQVSGTQPALTQTPDVQTCPVPQAPQSSFIPQPSPMMPQYLAAPPEAQVSGWQLGPPTQRPKVQTPSPAQAPQSSEPPLQPLPILPQYWPPAGVQVTDGVQAASPLPRRPRFRSSPAVPVVRVVPAAPVAPACPSRRPRHPWCRRCRSSTGA